MILAVLAYYALAFSLLASIGALGARRACRQLGEAADRAIAGMNLAAAEGAEERFYTRRTVPPDTRCPTCASICAA